MLKSVVPHYVINKRLSFHLLPKKHLKTSSKKLKYQNDDKIVDHIYLDKSLIGGNSNIYFIGDSKYYKDAHDITGAPLYKQFTYARNAIQYNVEQLYLEQIVGSEKLKELRYRDSIPMDLSAKTEEMQKFKDSLTEGYNVTPNFFIRNGVPDGRIDYADPQLNKYKSKIWKQIKTKYIFYQEVI